MTDHSAQAHALPDKLAQAANDIRQLETLMSRLLQVLTDNGFQVSVDLLGITGGITEVIESAHRDSQTQSHQLDELQQLIDTFALITSTLELDQVLEGVMDTVIRFTGAERAYLMLRDKQTGDLQIPVARNWDRETLSEGDVVFSRSVVTRALSDVKPILTTNAQADDRFQNVQSVVNNQLRSILCIPLILQGQAVGVLYADNRINQDIFRQEKVPLLTAFGMQAAIAIENARRYGAVREDLNKALNELQSLQIEIDKSRLERQVSEITETDYFQRLSVAARSMRRRFDKDSTSSTQE